MNELAGKKNIVYILAGETAMTGSTGAVFEGLDNSSLNQTAELLEITSFGNEYKKRIAGLKDSSVSLSGNYSTTQPDLNAGDYVYIGLYQNGTENPGKQVPCLVESVEYGADVNDKQTISISLQGNGAIEVLPARV